MHKGRAENTKDTSYNVCCTGMPVGTHDLCVECTVHVRCRTYRTAAEVATAAAVRHCLHPPGFVPVLCIQCRLIARLVGWVTNN